MNQIAAINVDGRAIPTPEELVARARAMIPALKERASIGTANRQLPKETIADLQEAGLFRVLQPRKWGGYEMSPKTFCDICIALAEGDMSVGWVYGVVAVHAWQMGAFDDRAAHDVWGDDDTTLISSSYMPTGKATPIERGYLFNGRWGYSSGSHHCDWEFLGGMVIGPDGPIMEKSGTFLLSRDQYEIVDTWDTPGLRGTGSHDIVVKDAFVPEYRTHTMIDGFNCTNPGMAVNDGPLYQIPFGQVFVRAVSTASIGALQAMIEEMKETARTRISAYGVRTKEDPIASLAIAEAQNTVDELTLVLHRNFDTLWSYGELRTPPPIELRSQYRFQASLPPERVTQAAARLFKAVGGAAAYNKNPYGRMLADINVGRQHAANQFESFGRNWGTVLLGEENTDMFM